MSLGDDLPSDLAYPGFEVSAQSVDLRSLISFVVGIRRFFIATAAAMHKRDLIFLFAADGSGR